MKARKAVLAVLLLVGPAILAFTPTATAAAPNDYFLTEATFPGITWHDIHGVDGSTTDVWAVGVTSTGQARVATRLSGTWALRTVGSGPPGSGGGMFSVWAVGGGVAYAIMPGSGASVDVVYKCVGAGTCTVAPGTNPTNFQVTHVAAITSTNIVFGGEITVGGLLVGEGGLVTYDGTSFGTPVDCLTGVTQAIDFGGDFVAMDMDLNPSVHADAIVAVTSPPTVPGCDLGSGSGNTPQTGFVAEGLSYHVASGTGVVTAVAVGAAGAILENDWTLPPLTPGRAYPVLPAASPTANTLFDVDMFTATDGAWAVGQDIIRRPGGSGVAWQLVPPTTASIMRTVVATGATNVWVAGDDGIIQRLQVITAVGPPVLSVAVEHHADLLEVANTPCLGEHTPFTLNIEVTSVLQTLTDGDVWIYSHESGLWIQDIDDSAWNPTIPAPTTAQFAAFSTTLPEGDYYALAIIDIAGLGGLDQFDSKAFTVSKSGCTDSPTDLTSVLQRLTRIERQANNSTVNIVATNADVNDTRAQQSYQNTLTNTTHSFLTSLRGLVEGVWSRVNTTCQKTLVFTVDCEGIGTRATTEHLDLRSHVDDRTTYTNDLINATAIGLNFTLGDLLYRIDHNVTWVNNTLNMGFGGFATVQGFEVFQINDLEPIDLAILVGWLILLLYSLRRGYFLPALISGIGVIASAIPDHPIKFISLVSLLVAGLIIQGIAGGRFFNKSNQGAGPPSNGQT